MIAGSYIFVPMLILCTMDEGQKSSVCIGSTIGMMIVSLAADVVLFVSCAVAVTLCVLQFH